MSCGERENQLKEGVPETRLTSRFLGHTVAFWKFQGGLKISEAPSKILGARLGPHGAVLWGARSRLGNFRAPLEF